MGGNIISIDAMGTQKAIVETIKKECKAQVVSSRLSEIFILRTTRETLTRFSRFQYFRAKTIARKCTASAILKNRTRASTIGRSFYLKIFIPSQKFPIRNCSFLTKSHAKLAAFSKFAFHRYRCTNQFCAVLYNRKS